jgi:hypothetical protein
MREIGLTPEGGGGVRVSRLMAPADIIVSTTDAFVSGVIRTA